MSNIAETTGIVEFFLFSSSGGRYVSQDERPNVRSIPMAPVNHQWTDEEHEIPNPIQLNDFVAHVSSHHKDTNMGFAKEYEQLRVSMTSWMISSTVDVL